ncbi:MAG: tRNA (N6-isopentenyl adenosine(37)-C2)-methylthiotransferase MiaB [Acidimicrobiia bacterium]
MPDQPANPAAATESPRRFHVRTYGCQMNEHDSERIAGLLAGQGMVATDDLEAADVVVLNTCCIRENADNKLYGHLGRLKALKTARPDLQIAVGGCLAQKDRELIVERAGHVDVVFGTHNLAHAGTLLERARTEGPVVEILEEHEAYPSALPAQRDHSHAAWVTIQLGCDNSCAFCIVPIVRGAEVSRRMGDIVREVEELAADGVREVTLLGQNVNSYGRDLGAGQYRPQFADLLRALDAVDGIDRIRFTSPHPKDLRPDTIAAMAECASVCEHLHLPLQSGSDRTLARMRRGYRAERYLEKLAAARAAIPDLAVTTDIIVGFPGETDDDFERTLEVVDAAAYDAAFTFVFSPRPGTPAAEMTELFVAPDVARERMDRLMELVERHALTRHEARIGRTESLVAEGPSKKDAALWSGRTRQNKLVHFPIDPLISIGHAVRAGDTVDVVITAAAPHWLRGDAVAVHPPMRRRRIRIPVAAGP